MRQAHPFIDLFREGKFQREQLRVKELSVLGKLYVPTGSIKDPGEWHIGKNTRLKTFRGTYPETDKYVLLVRIHVGRWRSRPFTIAVERKLYLRVAPRDHVPNPHLGGYNKEAHVDPRVGLVPMRT